MKKLLTTAQAAEYLGLKKSYLHKLMMNHEIEFYKPNGKMCFFDPDVLDRWLTRVRVPSNEELTQHAHSYISNQRLGR